MSRYTHQRRGPRGDIPEPLAHPKATIGKEMEQILAQASYDLQLPVSRLLAIALEHELERERPFDYLLTPPLEEYVEFAHADSAGRILNYINKNFPNGIGLDSLMLLRLDMGIDSKEEFMLGFRELTEKKMVESFFPLKAKYRYHKSYRYWRAAADVRLKEKQNRYKEIERITEKGPLDE